MSLGLQIGFRLLPYPAKVFIGATCLSLALSVTAFSLACSTSRSIDGGFKKIFGEKSAAIVAINVGLFGALINTALLRLTVDTINRNALLAIGISSACVGTLIAGALLDITDTYQWEGPKLRSRR